MPEAEESPDISVGQTLFDDIVTRFVNPEVAQRRQDGALPEGELIHRFQVLFPESGAPDVRLNHEVGGTVTATAARAIEAGEKVEVADIAGISNYEPRPEDGGVPHVTGFAHCDGWSLVFEFAHGHPSRGAFLSSGREFLITARQALENGYWGPFLDNAFSACELFAKAELLSCRPTVELVLNSKNHSAVAVPYHLWANLGNTDARFAKLLRRLAELRGAARYLDKDLELNAATAKQIFTLLEGMASHVSAVVESQKGEGETASFNVFATRELRAGQLISAEDFTLIPPRR